MTEITNETAKTADSVLESATTAATDVAKTASSAAQDASKTVSATAQDAADFVVDTSTSLYAQAKDMIGQAVEAAKEHPVTAAAIGAGVAATVAGAAYGVSKLLEDDDTPPVEPKPRPKPNA